MERFVLVVVVAALVGSGVAFGMERSCALARDARACARACEESVCKKGSDAEEPKISVFASFIRNIAKQRGISKTEAADLLYAMGVRGFDAGPSDSDLYELAGTCLKPINFYYFPDWFGCKNKNGAAVLPAEACLSRAVELGVPRIMVVPPDFTDGKENPDEFERILAQMREFVAEAKKRGVTITVEDFGGTANCCSYAKYLRRLLDEIPDLRFALDSGNLYYAGRGDDILEMMMFAKGRIGHVHLKDQTVANNREYASLGLGAVPNERIVKEVASFGYDGWYTLESPVGDVHNDSVRQIALLKAWLSEAKHGKSAGDDRPATSPGRFVAPHTEKVELKGDWRFVKADDPKIGTNYDFRAMSIVLDRADRGDLSGAPETDWAKPGFDDGAWKTVQVPHDWGIESTYDPSRRYGDAFLDVVGVGWYRRALDIPEDWKGKKIYFECDGAMSYAHVWINGRFVGGWPYGYTRFRLDLTQYLDFKGANTLAIRCHNVIDSSRWYTGGGLYRNCRLLVCPEDHVVPGSVRITTPEITVKRAKVRVCYEMSISGRKEFSFEVENPRLWDIDDPYLYEVAVEGDTYRYGIRTIAFHADERRFQLNGRTVPLNGVSMHHDFGVLGAAWNRTAQKRRLLLFKDAGVNAIRSSHNPPDEGLLELCDELGLLVKDEVFDEWKYLGRLNGSMGDGNKRVNGYTNLFDMWHERDLRAWIRTDRNHPSVIMYSLGNEIPDGKHYIVPTSEYVARSRELARIAASEDSTRPTTAANNNVANYTNDYPMTLALMGCNYYSWQYPELKRRYPDVPFFGTETVCMSSTRGEYTFPVAQAWPRKDEWTGLVNSSYCWQAAGWSRLNAGWACPPDVQWYWMDKVGTCMGEFVWTGVDYLGGPYWCDEVRTRLNRPSDGIHTCNTGFLDRAGFRKDAFWLFQSRWRPDLPMAHILPHWNWAGREGLVTPVYVFTSGDEGELFLNGQSLGRQRKQPGVWDRAYRLRWDDVRYAPGKLEVVAYKNGREWARDTIVTTGQVTQLGIESETDSIVSDGEDIAYVNVCVKDKDGNVVPRTRNLVKFSVEGPGFVLATDNGYEADMSDFHASEYRVFNGWVQALVRAKPGAKGLLTVTAVSDGLDPVKAKIAVGVKGR